MIKGLTLTQCLGTADEANQLAQLFAALGFESDKAPGPSGGCSFLAPCGSVELATSRRNGKSYLPDAGGPLWIHVTSLESVRNVTEAWLKQQTRNGELTEITEADTESRSFTVTPFEGVAIRFWEWNDPLRGRPVAVEGDFSATGMRFAIIVARWNAVITDRLLQGSLDGLLRSGASRRDIEVVRVPGAWEIPSGARRAAEQGQFDAVIALGVLLRGETAHYEAIYNEVSRGIGQSQQETGIPHAFGVLTCETLEQALDRAGLKSGNKGFEAALAAIEMVSLHRKLRASPERVLQRA